MRDELADIVYPVFAYGLNLKERLARGDNTLDLDTEQANLKRLLRSDSEARRWPEYGGEPGTATLTSARMTDGTSSQLRPVSSFYGIRYALACWLDELFILDSPWGSEWNEKKLETQLYGIIERAWKFWEQAKFAEAKGNDAVEAYFLCVMLGFRGELRDSPQRLEQWFNSMLSRIVKAQRQKWVEPQRRDPVTNVPPRHGRERLQQMIMVAAGSLLVLIPVVVFLIVRKLGAD